MGVIKKEEERKIWEKGRVEKLEVERIEEIEEVKKNEVIELIKNMEEFIGNERSLVNKGMK